MGMNDMLPAWLFGPFDSWFKMMERNEITIKEFSLAISNMEDVPDIVKQNWKDLSEDYLFHRDWCTDTSDFSVENHNRRFDD